MRDTSCKMDVPKGEGRKMREEFSPAATLQKRQKLAALPSTAIVLSYDNDSSSARMTEPFAVDNQG